MPNARCSEQAAHHEGPLAPSAGSSPWRFRAASRTMWPPGAGSTAGAASAPPTTERARRSSSGRQQPAVLALRTARLRRMQARSMARRRSRCRARRGAGLSAHVRVHELRRQPRRVSSGSWRSTRTPQTRSWPSSSAREQGRDVLGKVLEIGVHDRRCAARARDRSRRRRPPGCRSCAPGEDPDPRVGVGAPLQQREAAVARAVVDEDQLEGDAPRPSSVADLPVDQLVQRRGVVEDRDDDGEIGRAHGKTAWSA